MKKPTNKQKKEFWLKHGWHLSEGENYLGNKIIVWVRDGDKEGSGCTYTPPIDLNNLFKYAVPKYIEEIRTEVTANYTGNAYARLFERWGKQLFYNDWEDPALALFWAIYHLYNEIKDGIEK